MKPHKLCKLFPLIEGEELAALIKDIKANGLRNPIVTFEGKILDGQNRFKACQAAGIDPRFEEFTGKDPVEFVVSYNVNRRHLTESQRAMIAAEIAKARTGSGRNSTHLKTNAEAATQLKVSVDSVKKAKRVKAKSPALARKVMKGKISLNAADEQLNPPKPKPVTAPTPPQQPDIPDNIEQSPPKVAEKVLPMTVARFDAALRELEAQIPKDISQLNKEKFALPAMDLAKRLANPPRSYTSAYV